MPELSKKYTSEVGEIHRRKLGQFFTESRVARFMVNWVSSGKSSAAASLFDPAFGLGAFYDAARSLGFKGTYSGVEIDQKVLEFFHANRSSTACHIANENYLSLWGKSCPAIVCNPPYMRFQKFEGRDDVFSNFEDRLGVKLSGYTNIASAFLVKSICELSDGGRLAYIMPLEFLNAGYGAIIKRLLLERGSLRAVIKIDCEKDAFPDATTSVGIIFFEKSEVAKPVQFHVVHDLDHLEEALNGDAVTSIDANALPPNEKWLRFFEQSSQTIDAGRMAPLSAYGSFNRGIATGANEFFSLNKEMIATLGLGSDEIVPCITKSAQIKKDTFGADELAALADANAYVYLLSVKGRLSLAGKKYIEHGESKGFHNRYLTKTKSPWYKLENRAPAPLLFGVFSRGGFKIVRNYTNALNLTCYHGFQPNIFGRRYVDRLFLYFKSEAGRHVLSMNMRRYGDSLDKFEPNDLNHALCPNAEFFDQLGNEEVTREIEYLEKHGKLSARIESVFSSLLFQDLLSAEVIRHAA